MVVAFRRTPVRLFLTFCVSLILLVAVSALFFDGDGGPPTLGQRVFYAPLALVTLWTTIGVFRQGVWSGPDGLIVRNVFRRYDIDWADVEAIERPPPYGALRDAGLRIVLRDGRRISAALFGAGPFSRPTHADAVVSALRRDLQQYGEARDRR